MQRNTHCHPLFGVAWLAVVLFAAANAAAATRVDVAPGEVGLLELFTSEGCSSCPPADRYFSTLVDDPDLFVRLVPVAFHVDYWNYLGWKDRFSAAAFSDRQRGHVRAGRGRTVYTPGFFYNGEEWRQFFGGDLTALPPPLTGGHLSVVHDTGHLAVQFRPADTAPKTLFVSVARLGFGLTTAVRAGENRGRTLRHDFVVLGLDETAMTAADALFSARVAVPPAATEAEREALAIWVSDAPGGLPLQAAGFWIESPSISHSD